MDDEIDRGPTRTQLFERGIKRGVVGDIDIDHEVRPDAFGQGLEARAKGLALIGECQFRTGFGHRLGNAPSDGAFVRDTHDQAAFSFKHV